MSEKQDVAVLARQYATQMKAIANQMRSINEFYFNNSFHSGGDNAIVDADIVSTGITASELGDFVNFTNQVANLLGNAAVTQSAWGVVLDKVRNVNL